MIRVSLGGFAPACIGEITQGSSLMATKRH